MTAFGPRSSSMGPISSPVTHSLRSTCRRRIRRTIEGAEERALLLRALVHFRSRPSYPLSAGSAAARGHRAADRDQAALPKRTRTTGATLARAARSNRRPVSAATGTDTSDTPSISHPQLRSPGRGDWDSGRGRIGLAPTAGRVLLSRRRRSQPRPHADGTLRSRQGAAGEREAVCAATMAFLKSDVAPCSLLTIPTATNVISRRRGANRWRASGRVPHPPSPRLRPRECDRAAARDGATAMPRLRSPRQPLGGNRRRALHLRAPKQLNTVGR